MADDDDEDLYDEEFDFVDDDDDEEEEEDVEEEASADDSDLADEPPRAPARERERPRSNRDEAAEADGASDTDERDRADDADEPVDEYGRPEPAANYVVHLYEAKKFKRTIERPFTPEDAEAFASEFNRTGRNYGRFAVTGKNDAKPKKSLD